jgi:hypothetical protein
MSHERRGVRQGSGHYAPRRRAHSPAAPGAVFGSPLFRRTAKPKPQPGEQPSRGFGASTQGSVLAEGTEHKHQHPFWAGSSSARGFTAANFSVRISTGSGFCACGGSRTAPRAPIGWIVGSTPRILRQWACGRVASNAKRQVWPPPGPQDTTPGLDALGGAAALSPGRRRPRGTMRCAGASSGGSISTPATFCHNSNQIRT